MLSYTRSDFLAYFAYAKNHFHEFFLCIFREVGFSREETVMQITFVIFLSKALFCKAVLSYVIGNDRKDALVQQ